MVSNGGANGPGDGMHVRRVEPQDAMPLATMISDSFLAFNQSVNIPPHVDGFTPEVSRDLMKHFTSSRSMYGVVAVEESSGSLMAGGFMFPGDVYAIGPVFADNAFKGKGAGKAVMVALIEIARNENAKSIRLCQVAANPVSFGLYASLDFVPVECWMDLEGNVAIEQASSANRYCGFCPVTGVDVRRMEEADVKDCNELHRQTMGFDREERIKLDVPNGSAWVAVRAGEIIAYTTGFILSGHTVAKSEEVLAFMFTEVCRKTGNVSTLNLHVPGRLYPRLLRWAIAAKLKMMRSCWLMVIGSYQSPQNGMVYCPSIEG